MLRSLPVLSGPIRSSAAILRLGRCPDSRWHHRCYVPRPLHISMMGSGRSTTRLRRSTAVKAASDASLRGCTASGRLRPFSSTGGPSKKKDDDKDRERFYKLNEEIKALGAGNDKKGLILLVRRQQGEGGAKGLHFNRINCSNWLNKWTKEKRAQHLRGKPRPEVLWVLARTRYLLDTQPQTFEPWQVCTLANALGHLEYDWRPGLKPPHVLVMEGLAGWVGARDLRSFEPMGIANLIHAFAKLGLSPGEPVLSMVSAECVSRALEGFSARDMALVLKAFATLGQDPGAELCRLVMQRCMASRLVGFKAHEVADVLLSLGRLQVGVDLELLELVAAHFQALKLETLQRQTLANTLAGFALLRYNPGEELVAPAVHFCSATGFAGFSGSCLSTLLQALAVLRFPLTEDWMAAFHTRRREVTWNAFSSADLCGTLAAVLRLRLPVDRGLLRANASRLQLLLASLPQGTQDGPALQNALLVCNVARQVVFLDEARGVKELIQAVEQGWEAVKQRAGEGGAGSAEGSGVCAALRERSYDVEERAWLADRLLMLDAIITLPGGARMGVVVSDATDYFMNHPDVPTGEALYRWRMLDRAKEVGLVQEWVSVRDASEAEIGKIVQAAARLQPR